MRLTPNEVRVLSAAATGAGAKAAAAELGMSYQTYKNVLTLVYAKLDVQSLVQAFAVLGWLHVPGTAEIAEHNADVRLAGLRVVLHEIVDDLDSFAGAA